MKNVWFCFLLAIFMASCGKNGPTDDQLKDLCRNTGFAFRELTDPKAKDEAFQKFAKESEAAYDIQKITPEQVELLFTTGGESLKDYLSAWLAPILKQKAENEGTLFTYYYWKYLPENDGFLLTDGTIEAYKKLISQPDMADFIKNTPDVAEEVISGASAIKGDKWIQFEMVPQIKALLTYTLPDNAIERTIKVFNTALVSSLPSEDKEEIRKQTLKLYQELAERTTSPSQEKRAESQINYLQGAFATGTLVGNKAPALHFKWISNGKETSLDDFKGKVVMIDFWATKCAPCISSFPEIAALQEHYKNSPVAIIGVTSIMGYFVDTPNKRTVNTANAPEKETALMPPYMKNMGMTWRVAFTEEDVMNVQYGVLAIPHVTILDKEGRVRYNNVSGTNEEKIKLIDSLLNE